MFELFLNSEFMKFLLLTFLLSYFFGSISFAVIISKIRGLDDPRNYGSNNPGATNVLRSGDKIAALLTLFGDSLKGLIVILVTRNFFLAEPYNSNDFLIFGSAIIGVFLGHLFPIFFKFRGGKGVATGGGILFGVDLFLGISTLCVWVVAFCYQKISAIAAITSAISVFLFSIIFLPRSYSNDCTMLIIVVWAISLLLIFRHKDNLVEHFRNRLS